MLITLLRGLFVLWILPDDFLGPVNLGNPVEFTIKELAEHIVELTASKSELVYKPLPTDDPLQRKPDITLAKEKLGWEPDIQLKDGLIKTIAYFRGDAVALFWFN